jgi:hypothetical protein
MASRIAGTSSSGREHGLRASKPPRRVSGHRVVQEGKDRIVGGEGRKADMEDRADDRNREVIPVKGQSVLTLQSSEHRRPDISLSQSEL